MWRYMAFFLIALSTGCAVPEAKLNTATKLGEWRKAYLGAEQVGATVGCIYNTADRKYKFTINLAVGERCPTELEYDQEPPCTNSFDALLNFKWTCSVRVPSLSGTPKPEVSNKKPLRETSLDPVSATASMWGVKFKLVGENVFVAAIEANSATSLQVGDQLLRCGLTTASPRITTLTDATSCPESPDGIVVFKVLRNDEVIMKAIAPPNS